MIKNPNLRQKLQTMQSRVQNLTLFGQGPDGRRWGEFLKDEIEGRLATDSTAQDQAAELGKLFQRAHSGDIEARQQLNELVIETVQNYVVPTMNFGRFFEVRTLQDNQSPAIQNNTRQEIKAGYVGQDGQPHMTKVVRPQAEQLVDLHVLVSEEVSYRIRDIYTGNVEEAARATFDIAFDVAHQLEQILFDLITAPLGSGGAIGAFSLTSSNRANRVYNPHSRIRSGVLPTSNELQIANIGAGTKFGFRVFDEVLDYCVRWANTEADGDIMPTGEVIVPAQDIRGIADGITVTGQKATEQAEQLLRQGWLDVGEYLGVNWRVVADNTIARKACYPVLTKPVGILWMKPGMAQVEEKVNRIKNLASRTESQVFGSAIPIPQRKNMLRVSYQT